MRQRADCQTPPRERDLQHSRAYGAVDATPLEFICAEKTHLLSAVTRRRLRGEVKQEKCLKIQFRLFPVTLLHSTKQTFKNAAEMWNGHRGAGKHRPAQIWSQGNISQIWCCCCVPFPRHCSGDSCVFYFMFQTIQLLPQLHDSSELNHQRLNGSGFGLNPVLILRFPIFTLMEIEKHHQRVPTSSTHSCKYNNNCWVSISRGLTEFWHDCKNDLWTGKLLSVISSSSGSDPASIPLNFWCISR